MPRSEPFLWLAAPMTLEDDPAPWPREVDVAIVGARLTGLLTARTLARRGRSVLVLEKGAPAAGASGRNGGMVGGGHRLSLDEIEARFGRETGVALLREAHLSSAEFVRDVMHDESIDCDYRETGRFQGLRQNSEYEATTRWLDRLRSLNPVEGYMVSRARQRDEVARVASRGGVVFPRQGGIKPAKWAKGLLAAARRAGAQVRGGTPVLAVGRSGAGHELRIARSSVRAGTVLVATNGSTGRACPALCRRIVFVPSFIVATETLGASLVRQLILSGRMIVESRERHCYYRPSPDSTRIVFGGRAAMFEAPEALAQSEMRRLFSAVFPELPDVGRIGGLWHAMGYSGSGNAMAPWLGHKAALQNLGEPEGETAFSRTGFATRWWHKGQAWFLPFADMLFRARHIAANRGYAA